MSDGSAHLNAIQQVIDNPNITFDEIKQIAQSLDASVAEGKTAVFY